MLRPALKRTLTLAAAIALVTVFGLAKATTIVVAVDGRQQLEPGPHGRLG